MALFGMAGSCNVMLTLDAATLMCVLVTLYQVGKYLGRYFMCPAVDICSSTSDKHTHWLQH